LVNNAGLGEAELFERSSWNRIQQIIAVNVLAMLRLAHYFLPGMISQGHGAILNIGSGAGYAAMPNAAVYTASKHFVRAFTESLRAQLAGTGISVSEAAPGPVESESDQVAGIEGGATHFPHHCQRMCHRHSSRIRERFASDFSGSQLQLVDESPTFDAPPLNFTTNGTSGSPNSR